MTTIQVVCTEQTECSQRGHIVAVGTEYRTTWTVDQVWSAIDRGEFFYTYGGGKVAAVHKYVCGCGLRTLRSAPDATYENNLDYLPLCPWRAA